MSKWLFSLVAVSIVALFGRPAHADLLSHVSVSNNANTWTYTLFNDEPSNSPNYLASFNLAVNAPIMVVTAPSGWVYDTDFTSYVLWFNTDPALPYPNDVAPGASLGDFSFQSTTSTSAQLDFGIAAWNHDADMPGTNTLGKVSSPSISPAATPEPGTWATLVAGSLGIGMLAARRRRRN